MKFDIPHAWQKDSEDFSKLSLLPPDPDTATSQLKFLSHLTERSNALIDLDRDIVSLEMLCPTLGGEDVRRRALTTFEILDKWMPEQFFQDLRHLSIPLEDFLDVKDEDDGKTWKKLFSRYQGLRVLTLPCDPMIRHHFWTSRDPSFKVWQLATRVPMGTSVNMLPEGGVEFRYQAFGSP